MSRYNAIERTGINAVESVVVNELKWIFREQPIADMGIDAHVELVEDGNPSGKLIGLQIKTGKGNFPETKETLWVQVNEGTVERTKKGWKVSLPKTAKFDPAFRDDLTKLFEGTP